MHLVVSASVVQPSLYVGREGGRQLRERRRLLQDLHIPDRRTPAPSHHQGRHLAAPAGGGAAAQGQEPVVAVVPPGDAPGTAVATVAWGGGEAFARWASQHDMK